MKVLVADGSMGTELLARSGFTGRPASLNVLQPSLVLSLHREYVAAGARLLVANSLGATLEEAAAGVRLARSAAGSDQGRRSCPPIHPFAGFARGPVPVAASLTCDAATPQILTAVEDADLILFETVTSLAALQRVERPAAATLSFDADGRLDGLTPAEVARKLAPLGLIALGYGCGFGPEAARPVLAELRQAAPEAVLIAKPNLGLPPYDVSPAQLADWAVDMAELGIDVIGACCGSAPAHIKAVAQALT